MSWPRIDARSWRRFAAAVVHVGLVVGLAIPVTAAALAEHPAAVAPAPAGPEAGPCEPSSIFVNTIDPEMRLIELGTDGVILGSVNLDNEYSDIAFSADGSKLYGITFAADPVPSTLYTIDAETGAVVGSLPLSLGLQYPNALSSLPNGNLVSGGDHTTAIIEFDPNGDGTGTAYASFPDGYWSAGDFLTLPDGDTLAIANSDSPESTLFRIGPDRTAVAVGTVPTSFGAAQSGGSIYLAGPDGTIRRIDSLPTTPTTEELPVTVIAKLGQSTWGAASRQDTGLCAGLSLVKSSSLPSPDGFRAGETVTYSFLVTNTGTLPVHNVSVAEVAFTGSAPVNTIEPSTVASIAPGESARFTADYTVTISDVEAGEITNTALARGEPPGHAPEIVSRLSTTTSRGAPASAVVTPLTTAGSTAATAALANTGSKVLFPLGCAVALAVLGLAVLGLAVLGLVVLGRTRSAGPSRDQRSSQHGP